jgi:hypothetical protein
MNSTHSTEEEVVAAKRGKWSAAGVPHKGWVCVDIEDLGEPSAKGNPYLMADGWRATVYPHGGGWACTIAVEREVEHSRRNFKTISEAKLAAFDLITKRLSKI